VQDPSTGRHSCKLPSFCVRIRDTLSNTQANNKQPYTVLLVDANIVGTNATGASQNLHWLTNGVTLGSANDGAYPLAYDSANDIRAYAGPGPAPSSGAHRYMFLFYEQAADFAAPEGYNAKIESVDAFDLQSYVTSAKLGNLVAANYMTVENGQASMTVEKTMPVDSSTLSAAEATGSSAGNSTASATETGSASAGAGATSGASRSGSPSNTGSAGNSSNTSVPPATNTNGAAGMTLPAMGLAMVAAVAAALV
jgi:hypothetical protein